MAQKGNKETSSNYKKASLNYKRAAAANLAYRLGTFNTGVGAVGSMYFMQRDELAAAGIMAVLSSFAAVAAIKQHLRAIQLERRADKQYRSAAYERGYEAGRRHKR